MFLKIPQDSIKIEKLKYPIIQGLGKIKDIESTKYQAFKNNYYEDHTTIA